MNAEHSKTTASLSVASVGDHSFLPSQWVSRLWESHNSDAAGIPTRMSRGPGSGPGREWFLQAGPLYAGTFIVTLSNFGAAWG